ncbi:MAG: RDD family protein [Bdellovibrionales bacterium]|nr:RDD family protein [Bdellovibrionales bacterium]
MNELHKLYGNKDNAAFDQRLIAFVIDTFVAGLLAKLIAPITGPFVPVALLYYVVPQLYLGYTLGKYLLGLRVISDDGHVSVGRMLLRETIGRLLSSLPLFMGYLSVIFSKDRCGWHDRIAHTRVISLKPVHTTAGGQVMRAGVAMLMIGVLAVGGLYFAMLHTSYPVHMLAKQLNMTGIKMEGVSGSFSKGFRIAKVSFEENGNSFEFNNIQLLMNREAFGFAKVFTNEKLTVDHFIVGDGFVKVVNWGGKKDANPLKKKTEDPRLAAQDRKAKPRKESSALFKVIEIGNINFDIMGNSFKLNRFSVADFAIKTKSKEVMAKHLYLASSDFDVLVKGIHFNEEKAIRKAHLQALIKKDGRLLQGLKRNLDFQIDMDGGAGLSQLRVKAFNGKLQASMLNKEFELNINNLNLNQYIKQTIPIKTISLNLDKYGARGQLALRNRSFHFPQQNLTGLLLKGFVGSDERGMGIKLKPLAMIGPNTWSQFRLPSGDVVNPDKPGLSLVYTGKPFPKLSAKSHAMLEADQRFFAEGPFYQWMGKAKFLPGMSSLPMRFPSSGD